MSASLERVCRRGGWDIRGLSAGEARGWREDKAAGESVCTSPGPDPAGATGWECQERLRGEEGTQWDIKIILFN